MSDKAGSSLMGNTGPQRTTFPRDKSTTGVGSLGDLAACSGKDPHHTLM